MRAREVAIVSTKKIDVPLIVLNCVLVIAAVLSWWGAGRYFSRKLEAATLRENSFLTTEWRLLKEYKDLTDRQLSEKDREIEILRARYRELQRGNSPAELLSAAALELERAEAERQGLLAARFVRSSATAASAAADIPVLPPLPAPETKRTDSPAELLRRRLLALEAELGELGRENGRLRLDLDALRAAPAAPSPAAAELPLPLLLPRPAPPAVSAEPFAPPLAPPEAPADVLPGVPLAEPTPSPAATADLSAPTSAPQPSEDRARLSFGWAEPAFHPIVPPAEPAPSPAGIALDAAVSAIERGKAALPAAVPPSLDDLRTRSLLRAIVRTPAIRADYPDLPEALDRYLELYGNEERLKGKREAYGAAVESVNALRKP